MPQQQQQNAFNIFETPQQQQMNTFNVQPLFGAPQQQQAVGGGHARVGSGGSALQSRLTPTTTSSTSNSALNRGTPK